MLWIVSLVVMILFIGILVVCFTLPYPEVSAEEITHQGRISNDWGKSLNDDDLSLESFKKIWSLPLRRPLYDPPKTNERAPPPPPKPDLNLKLLGLIDEPGHGRAIIRTEENKNKLVSVGDVLFDQGRRVKVLSITEKNLTIDYDGEVLILALDKKKNE